MLANPSNNFYYHLFVYGYPGSGKTRVAGDFHKAGQSVVHVGRKPADMTLEGLKIPFLNPTTDLELRAIIEAPQMVLEQYIHPVYPEYVPRTFVFDIVRDFQGIVMGNQAIPEHKIGKITIPPKAASGMLARPGSRNDKIVGNELDYRMLDAHMRSILTNIDQMPYNTIVTAHADSRFSAKNTPGEVLKKNMPSIEGYALKYDLPGLVSDFFLALEERNGKFLCHPISTDDWFARNRFRDRGMSQKFDWTGKNFYEILEGYRNAH